MHRLKLEAFCAVNKIIFRVTVLGFGVLAATRKGIRQ